jgi:hypothetical protein
MIQYQDLIVQAQLVLKTPNVFSVHAPMEYVLFVKSQELLIYVHNQRVIQAVNAIQIPV